MRILAALLMVFAVGCVLEEPPSEQDPSPVLEQARKAFALRNYRETIRLAQSASSDKNPRPDALELRRLHGLSLIRLRQYDEGVKLLEELIKSQPRRGADPEIALELANARLARNGQPAVVIDAAENAIALLLKADRTKDAVDLSFRFADWVRANSWSLHDPRDRPHRQDQVVRAMVRALQIYDRILALPVSIDDQVRALSSQARTVLQFAYAIDGQTLPVGLTSRHDLAHPYATAIGFEREIVRRFSDNAAAPDALLRIAAIQSQTQQMIAATATLRELISSYPKSPTAVTARQRIDQIEAPELFLRVDGTALPGQKPAFHWNARNIETLHCSAYPVELFDVLRNVEQFHDISRYQPKEKAAAQWTIPTGDQKDHLPVASNDKPAQAPVTQSGAYLVVVEGTSAKGKAIAAKTLIIVSRLAVVSKMGKTSAEYLVVDALTGKPHAGARLLLQRYKGTRTDRLRGQVPDYEYREVAVPDSGLYSWNKSPDAEQSQVLALARQGKDYAVVGDSYYPYWHGAFHGQGLRVYGYTDRPIYRPGQTVHFRQLIRDYQQGELRLPTQRQAIVRIQDARGQRLYEKTLELDEFGAVDGYLSLSSEAALGMYSLSIELENQTLLDLGPGLNFRVEEYKKPEYEVVITPDKPAHKTGATVEATVHGEYYFGGPVPNANVSYTVTRQISFKPWWREDVHTWFSTGDDEDIGAPMFRGRGRYVFHRPAELVSQGSVVTDAFGNARISFKTAPIEGGRDETVQYVIEASMVDQSRRQITSRASVAVAPTAISFLIRPDRSLYQPGDRAKMAIRATNPNQQPVPFKGTARLFKVIDREARDESGKVKTPEKLSLVFARPVEAGKEGETVLATTFEEKGYFKIEVSAPDPFGDVASGHVYLWVSNTSGEMAHFAYRDIELVVDRSTFAVGDTARVLINSKHTDTAVLLTAEADDLYVKRMIPIERGSATVELPIEKSFRPQIVLSVCLVHDNKIFTDDAKLSVPPVESVLNVEIKAPKNEFRPRETAELELVVRDHQGQPVEGEFSLAVFDASILAIQSETRGDIRTYFYGRKRPRTVRTSSSFSYQLWSHGYAKEAMLMGAMAKSSADSSMENVPAHRSIASAAPQAVALEASAGGADKRKAQSAAPVVRSDFRDAVQWLAHWRTDSSGRATSKVTFPDSLTTWRLVAIGIDKQSRVGEASRDVRTKKNIIARLEGPRFFVERDQATLSVIVHNYLETPQHLSVQLETGKQIRARGPSSPREIDVSPGGETRVDFPVSVVASGKTTIQATVLGATESDAVKQEFECLEYGAEKLLASAGVLIGKSEGERHAKASFDIPAAIRTGSQRLTLKASPTVAGVMLESLPYLIEYPYGCTEQTMSRFVPVVLTKSTLKRLGMDLSDLAKLGANDPLAAARWEKWRRSPVVDSAELDKMVAAGLKRLADFQQPDGGWGWWKNDQSNPYISAYVVEGLVTARDAGVAVPPTMIERGVNFLASQARKAEPLHRFPWQEKEDKPLRAYILFVLGEAQPAMLKQPDLAQRLADVFQQRDELEDYARALLTLALHRADRREQAEITLGNIKDRARVEQESGTASWGDETGYFYWHQSGTEATCFSLRALLAMEPSSPLIPQVVQWLVRHRRGTRWFSTKDTAIACHALSEYLDIARELDPDLTVELEAKGVRKTFHFTKDNLFSNVAELTLAGEELGDGSIPVSVRATGRGNLYWSAASTFFTKEDQIAPAGNELFVERIYTRLVPKKNPATTNARIAAPGVQPPIASLIEMDRQPLKEGDSLASGDLLEVTLKIKSLNNFEYLMFEDPKPAGCEALETLSGASYRGGFAQHIEFRDERVAFFSSYLNQGTHELSYRLRCETPGVFHALPSRAECMYAPLVRGNAASNVIRIVDQRDAGK